MNRFAPSGWLAVLLALFILSACESDRVLTVRADGSGRITERFLAGKDAYMKEDQKPAETLADALSSAALPRPTGGQIAKHAAGFGEGVEVVEFKVIEDGEMLGYQAVYSVADVSRLRADVFVGEMGPGASSSDEANKKDPTKYFQFTKGDVAELVVPVKSLQIEKTRPADLKPPPGQKLDAKQQAAFVDAIKHYRLRLAIRVEGEIRETNAKYREGNEVILSDWNIKGMAVDPKYAQNFADAAAGKESSDPASNQMPEDDRYLKDEPADSVKIRFK